MVKKSINDVIEIDLIDLFVVRFDFVIGNDCVVFVGMCFVEWVVKDIVNDLF